jgi:hypothetical protein
MVRVCNAILHRLQEMNTRRSKYRLVYSESDGHFYVIPVDHLEDWRRWMSQDEPQGRTQPAWAVIVHQSAEKDGIDNALAYLSFAEYFLEG